MVGGHLGALGLALVLDAALDDLRDRYGFSAITRAAHLGRDQRLSVPLLSGGIRLAHCRLLEPDIPFSTPGR